MSLVTLLDDSSLEKLRKSVYVFSAVGVISCFYQLQITAPKSLVSSLAASSSQNVFVLNYQQIATLVCIVIAYVSIRLYFSWKVSLAKFSKDWVLDEFDEKFEKGDLLTELSKFNDQLKGGDGFAKVLGNSVSSLNIRALDCTKRLYADSDLLDATFEKYTEPAQKLSTLQVLIFKLLKDVLFEHTLLTKEEIAQFDEFAKNLELKTPIVENQDEFLGTFEAVKKYYEQIQKVKDEVNSLYKESSVYVNLCQAELTKIKEINTQLEEASVKYQEFVDAYPGSIFDLMFKTEKSVFLEAKNTREIELRYFELYIPLAIAVLSFFYCLWHAIPLFVQSAVTGSLFFVLSFC